MRACVVVAGPGDGGAATLVRALRARGTPVLAVDPAALGAARWVHTVDPAGRTSTTIGLPDGGWIDDQGVGAVLWRAPAVPLPQFARSPAGDRDYAATEYGALVVSWLRGLGDRVVNEPDGISPVGPSWTPRRALVEAHRAGLPVATSVIATSGRLLPDFRGSPYEARMPLEPAVGPPVDRVLVVGSEAHGRVADRFGPACVRLAARARCRVLEVELCAGDHGHDLAVARVSPTPALGEPWEAEAVAGMLERMAGAAPTTAAHP